MNVKKRIFSMLLAILMVLTIFPLQTDAYAANVTSVHPDSKCNVAIAEDLIESYYNNHPDERPVTVG